MPGASGPGWAIGSVIRRGIKGDAGPPSSPRTPAIPHILVSDRVGNGSGGDGAGLFPPGLHLVLVGLPPLDQPIQPVAQRRLRSEAEVSRRQVGRADAVLDEGDALGLKADA